MHVVILAGGLGTRLSELTSLMPKPMVEIGDYPILWHIMKIYSHYGYNKFILCLGYKSYYIKERFTNYFIRNNNITVHTKDNKVVVHNSTSKEDWEVTMIDTGHNAGTAGRIKKVIDYIDGDDFMMTYGDGLSNVNIDELVKFHKSHGKLCTMTAIVPEGRFGKLIIEDSSVIEFGEKKDTDSFHINGGFMVMNKKIIDYITHEGQYFEREPLEELAKSGQLMAYNHNDFWFAMDTLKNKNDLEQLRLSGNAPRKIWN